MLSPSAGLPPARCLNNKWEKGAAYWCICRNGQLPTTLLDGRAVEPEAIGRGPLSLPEPDVKRHPVALRSADRRRQRVHRREAGAPERWRPEQLDRAADDDWPASGTECAGRAAAAEDSAARVGQGKVYRDLCGRQRRRRH